MHGPDISGHFGTPDALGVINFFQIVATREHDQARLDTWTIGVGIVSSTVDSFMTIKRQEFGVRAFKAVVHNKTVYLAGMIAEEAFLSVGEQTHRVLDQMEKRLESVGSSKQKLIMINIFLADMRRFQEMNDVWDAWLDKTNAPARACVQGSMARPGYEIEMTAVAALD